MKSFIKASCSSSSFYSVIRMFARQSVEFGFCVRMLGRVDCFLLSSLITKGSNVLGLKLSMNALGFPNGGILLMMLSKYTTNLSKIKVSDFSISGPLLYRMHSTACFKVACLFICLQISRKCSLVNGNSIFSRFKIFNTSSLNVYGFLD